MEMRPPASLPTQQDPRARELGAVIWIMIGLFTAAAAGAFLRCGFRVAGVDWRARAEILLAGGLATYLLVRNPGTRKLGIGFNAVLQSSVLATAGMMLTYAAATMGRPLVDAELLRIDHLLGYEWSAYARFLATHRAVASIILPGYWMIFLQPFIVICALASTGRTQRLEKFMLASLITLMMTSILFALYPATTAWTHLGLTDAQMAPYRYLPLSSENWIHDLIEIRGGGGRLLHGMQGSGLTAFPSYHCVAALLYVWAAWPVRLLRPAMISINATMIAATPIVGGHYLIDLLGGAIVMAAGVMLAERLHGQLLALRDGWRLRPSFMVPAGPLRPRNSGQA